MSKRMEMTYEELMSVHRQESKQNSLVKISSDFYDRTAGYLDALGQRLNESRSSGSDVSGMLHNQLNTAREKSAEVYETRMRKIALMSMVAAFGGEAKMENAVPEELEAFETLKSFFTEHSRKTMATRPENGEPAKGVNPSAAKEEARPAPKKAEEKPKQQGEAPAPNQEIILVRILEDLPTFAGTDKNYHLSKEDLISLPRNIADILVKHNKAIEVRSS
jgi:DNA replication initiation complex subunit (GINS family)